MVNGMDFEKYGEHLIYFNPTEVKNIHISSEYNLNEIIKIEKVINNLSDITNISFIGDCKLISYLDEEEEYINIVGVNINLAIEYQNNKHISRNIVELESYETLKSKFILMDISLYINTIAIRINKDEVYISIIYSLYA